MHFRQLGKFALLCVCTATLCWVMMMLSSGTSLVEISILPDAKSPPRLLHEGEPAQPILVQSAGSASRSRFDPYVRPATATSSVISLAATVVGQNGFAVSELLNGPYRFEIGASAEPIRLVTNSAIVTLKGTAAAPNQIVVVTVGDQKYKSPPSSDDSWAVDVTLPRQGVHTLRVVLHERTTDGDGNPTDTEGAQVFVAPSLKISLPVTTDPAVPALDKVSNTAFLRLQDMPTATTGIKIYGRFLELAGQQASPRNRLKFLVFDNSSAVKGFVGEAESDVNYSDTNSWRATLELPELPRDFKGQVFVIAEQPGQGPHSLATKSVDFVMFSTANTLAAPSKPNIMKLTDGTATAAVKDSRGVALLNSNIFQASVSTADLDDAWIVFFVDGNSEPFVATRTNTPGGSGKTWTATITAPSEGQFDVVAVAVVGDFTNVRSAAAPVLIRSTGPRVLSVEPTNLTFSADRKTITVRFNPENKLDVTTNAAAPNTGQEKRSLQKANFVLKPSQAAAISPQTVKYNTADNSVTVVYQNAFPPELYKFTVENADIVDVFGNTMAAPYETQLIMPVGGETPTVAPGISGPTGPYVAFGEYTKPRPFIDGFNPSDHVETRVSRLYYFRDAHRVAQIINRESKSHNRAAVDMQRQLADKSRQIADQATDDRRAKERRAVEAAKKTREAEHEHQQSEQTAQRAAQEAAAAAQAQRGADAAARDEQDPARRAAIQADADNLADVVRKLESVAESAKRQAEAAAHKVQQLREEEAQLTEEWQASIAVEDRAREEQFRREVAAAHADPDTYAAGKPDSIDPVRQVSVSVIGEGLIQLRGPIKGVNIIRTMINQIDAPVGQVRVGVHTVQINGEKGDRMELVAGKIQRYIDHSRFLTLQSAEMLRKAIVQVAAQRAMELGNVPGLTQEERDRSYLYSFFGEDFVRELEAMDSEFLATGNKLLSIHSMDSTSLASAMFIMALAKNTTRMQILQTFEGMMQGELPMAEQNYFEAGLTCDGKEKLFGKYCKQDEFQLLSQNARFQSIRGMFNVEIAEDDTMTPIQREFVRLAQIFKSRLIVEMELKQRIMERAVIEERLGDREKELRDARENEAAANQAKQKAQAAVRQAQKDALVASQKLLSVVQGPKKQAERAGQKAQVALAELSSPPISDLFQKFVRLYVSEIARTRDESAATSERVQRETLDAVAEGQSVYKVLLDWINDYYRIGLPPLAKLPPLYPTVKDSVTGEEKAIELGIDDAGRIKLGETALKLGAPLNAPLNKLVEDAKEIGGVLNEFRLDERHQQLLNATNVVVRQIESREPGYEIHGLIRIRECFENYRAIAEFKISQLMVQYDEMSRISAELGRADPSVPQLYQSWVNTEQQLALELNESQLAASAQAFDGTRNSFQTLLERGLDYEFALREAEAARRPLDHKKFLDMLVDEMEDKYIELLEGTRAHTANIDAYIKRLMTSLDDDFNTQFYYPTFRKVREASQLWDVQMGQVETTTVLANNRAFAKVSPEATMEFDLPKRDILITEAMDGAKAMINDFGALAQDPTFLAMAQLGSGSPTSSQMGGASGGQATVRNVLPGLSTDTAESVLSQQGPGGSTFGSAMEALIPDPAIYKFETGTGWEIRPVIQPDGQALVFHFNYMYTTNVREPVRADEKHLGRVKRHFVDTDVQLSNFELREISRYTVALKASRTARGVPLFEDIPVVGVLFRPQPSDESSLQQNVILGQATIFPTVFDLMGLRWAPVVADLDPLRLSNDEFIVRNRRRALINRVFDQSSSEVDKFLRIPEGERRMDLYRSQETIPSVHPNGYDGPGANLRDSQLQEGYDPTRRPESQFIPGESSEGSPYLRSRRRQPEPLYEVPLDQPHPAPRAYDSSSLPHRRDSRSGVANVEYQVRTGDAGYAGQQAEYVTPQKGPHASSAAPQMQRLPTVNGAPRPLPEPILRPTVR